MKVFVYGTLKKGFSNHRLLENSEFLGECGMWLSYKMYSCGFFPALVPCGNNLTWIKGEVYKVCPDTLEDIDALEGYPDLYEKATLKTKFGDATVYYMDTCEKSMTLIPDGEWH